MTDSIPPIQGSETLIPKPNQNLGLTFDWEDWLPYFENADIPDTQKREMIETLWQIVVAFVDLGFDLNPHQQVGQQSCGQNIDLKALLESAVLKSPTTKKANEQSLTHSKPRTKPSRQKEPTP